MDRTVTVRADPVAAARPSGAARPGAAEERRHGIGQDTHPFGPGSPLQLGGLTFPGVPRLLGHSDGDVVLHAVADALLGATGLGDLGRWFPADSTTPAGVASTDLLSSIVARVAERGWRTIGVDVTVIAARPRLGHRLDEMRAAVAAALGTDAEVVNIKASTGNLDGSEGAGRTVSALALAVVGPLEQRS